MINAVQTPGAIGPGSLAVSTENLGVDFGNFKALKNVSVGFEVGKIHAVVGQNGAGKTTFSKVLMGLVKASHGSLTVNGLHPDSWSVRQARLAGLDMVHQIFTMPPNATVAEAFEFFQSDTSSLLPYRKSILNLKWQRILAEFEVNISPEALINSLSIEAVQSLEIVRALMAKTQVLILDEPTAALAPPESKRLFENLRRLKEKGITIIIVLHKVVEVLEIADTVTVLRDGECIKSAVKVDDFDAESLTNEIIGLTAVVPQKTELVRMDASSEVVLTLVALSTKQHASESALASLDLTVRPGEIVGIAGVEGNGQRALVEVIMGLVKATSGDIFFENSRITNVSVRARRMKGIRVIPFDRLTEGVSTTKTLWENTAAGSLINDKRRFLFVSPKELRKNSEKVLKHWQVKYQSLDQYVSELSGGNVQRLIFSRELDSGLKLLIAAQPTRGLDVGATAFVHETLDALRNSGAGVLLVSADLEELFALSDRLIVLQRGCISGSFTGPYDRSLVGNAMVGTQ
ncbi:MAG: ATP-binding cassette domain-containing protein [Actinobacteria bacterium]|uniref:Unannotated protein n=1 Tax=freshwater metagenome TaxID=449393 RepID=A0A6J7PNE5_9ZZZZ|nr:ATP-binding cassette domain-containing protein [Actinomycetota bacterium]MSY35805.1 ATP-binding cassette domain-containing protein [Actinomycetota bacterium]MTH92004.1 ATP-binding cassette domain-containing protein [Actinomycetota bacterium]